ncbi:Germinal Center-Associated Signaling And Motility Protein [Manis pentadactyla]|nr:Germinal Center-Associated Signaling And Motility Protein [Manis pentadactyla]
MGNSLLRENRRLQNTQGMPWKLRNQNTRQRTSRCWDCYFAEGCFCLSWKKLHIFKARQDSQKENERMSSAPIQNKANQSSSEDLCYTLIDHNFLRKRPSENSVEGCYENVSLKTERPRASLGGTETEYSLLHVPSTPRHPPPPEAIVHNRHDPRLQTTKLVASCRRGHPCTEEKTSMCQRRQLAPHSSDLLALQAPPTPPPCHPPPPGSVQADPVDAVTAESEEKDRLHFR